MLQRVITGAVIAIVMIAILFSNVAIVSTFVGMLILIAQCEISNVIGIDKKNALVWCNLIFSALFIVVLCISGAKYIAVTAMVYLLMLFAIMLFQYEKIGFSDVSVAIFAMIYITASMLHIIVVRNMDLGYLYIFLIFIGAFATDTCAYFVGVLFGKHKLCEKISPKKTIEGAVGGEIGTILLMILFGYVVGKVANVDVNYFALAILGALSGLISQLGDLTASIVKREYNVKDYGHILPGHGGVMDRIDSVILMAPLVCYYVTFLPVFVAK